MLDQNSHLPSPSHPTEPVEPDDKSESNKDVKALNNSQEIKTNKTKQKL